MPIHSSYAPKVFVGFLEKLPKDNNISLFGIITSGYMAGDVLSFQGQKLEEKGYVRFLYRNIVVGNNIIGKLFGVSQRSIGKIHEKYNF